MTIEATTNAGIHVSFDPSKVTDWSWNALAMNTPDDPSLEVVFDRAEIEAMTQKAFFFGHDAERVAVCLLRYATAPGWWISHVRTP